jgi:C1A family cysteine protease
LANGVLDFNFKIKKIKRRRKMKKTIVCLLILSFICLFQDVLLPGDSPSKKPGLTPVNPDFLEYLEDIKKGQRPFHSEDGHPLGYIPSPVDLSHVKGVVDKRVANSYAAEYDLREKNKLTPVKDQGNCGSCWTFAAFASLESYLMPLEQNDFAEQHLNANHGFDTPECEGGNACKATAYLARWDGPIDENDVPYPYTSSIRSGYVLQKHVQQVIFLPERSGYLDNDNIKYFIKNYGAVHCAFNYNYSYYNPETSAYYNNYNKRTNHAVAIVGWNDNYSANNFDITPPGNGAFIIKNSWGTKWGKNGYFYISYYDNSLSEFVIFNNAEPTDNYDTIYQYDPLGWTTDDGYSDTVAWGANIFTAAANHTLKAVGFYTNDSNVKYKIYVYKGVDNGDPRSGTLSAQKSGTKTYPGYYTVAMDSEVSLNNGDKFSVVIKFENSGYGWPIAIEYPFTDYSSGAAANSGESFKSYNGTSWDDITDEYPDTNVCIKAFAKSNSPVYQPEICCNRTHLNFTGIIGGSVTGLQTFMVSNSGDGTLNWTVSDNIGWLSSSPTAGTNSGVVTVSVNPAGLAMGSYIGTITITDPNATNSPQTVAVFLNVISASQDQPPFGSLSTPLSGSAVSSSVPVTGWVLDDVEVVSVKIYRGTGNNLAYIGDASLVEGARPDIEAAYPEYPMNYKAGWGYMLLTYFLPNGGNGSYTLHAIAIDKAGQQVTLGTSTFTCDNANAVKPFGAIDTPKQGGTASGSSFRNSGWVLTPMPNKIPEDGSTIDVYVDGQYLGHPVYNIYRSDIASFFPGYANSSGAHAYFDFDTTTYSNGIHSIYWIAADNAGNADGIGSRYFSIQNTGVASKKSSTTPGTWGVRNTLHPIPVDYSEPVRIKRGCKRDTANTALQEIYPDDKGNISIELKELQLLEIHFFDSTLNVEPRTLNLSRLPVGSTLDREKGIFYWQPGPGFIGEYQLVFIVKEPNEGMIRKNIIVTIIPKFTIER